MRRCTTTIQNNHIPMFTNTPYRWSVLFSKTVLHVQERETNRRGQKGKSQSIRLDQKISIKYQKSTVSPRLNCRLPWLPVAASPLNYRDTAQSQLVGTKAVGSVPSHDFLTGFYIARSS